MDAKQLREMVLDVLRGSLTIRQTVSYGMTSVTVGTAILLDNVEICNDSVDVPVPSSDQSQYASVGPNCAV